MKNQNLKRLASSVIINDAELHLYMTKDNTDDYIWPKHVYVLMKSEKLSSLYDICDMFIPRTSLALPGEVLFLYLIKI